MTSHIGTALLLYAGCVLELAGAGGDERGIEPRWLLLVAAHVLWTQRPGPAVLWGSGCGLCWGVTHGSDLGLCTVIVSSVVWLLGALRRARRWSAGAAYLLTVFACTVCCVSCLDVVTTRVVEALGSELQTWGIRTCAQGVMTALWGGGLWGLSRGLRAPLEWRTSQS